MIAIIARKASITIPSTIELDIGFPGWLAMASALRVGTDTMRRKIAGRV
ncbi:hypothetical protein [Bradyrhizobium erythrophlei]